MTYSHTVITPVIVAPGNDKVIALQPEFITPQDGHKKQDCENAAAKRWFVEYGPQYKDFGVTILGDDLSAILIMEFDNIFLLFRTVDSLINFCKI